MASRWYCRFPDGDRGPLAFDELVQMIRDGALKEEDLVRREGIDNWHPAEKVVGLFHRARKASPAASRTPLDEPTARSKLLQQASEIDYDEEEEDEPERWQLSKPRIAALTFVTLVIAVGVWFAWSSQTEATRFPMPARLRARAAAAGMQYFFLGWGPFNVWEYAMAWFNAVALGLIAAFVVWRCLRPKADRA